MKHKVCSRQKSKDLKRFANLLRHADIPDDTLWWKVGADLAGYSRRAKIFTTIEDGMCSAGDEGWLMHQYRIGSRVHIFVLINRKFPPQWIKCKKIQEKRIFNE